eukprot:2160277-Prymnesium_polylepis.1
MIVHASHAHRALLKTRDPSRATRPRPLLPKSLSVVVDALVMQAVDSRVCASLPRSAAHQAAKRHTVAAAMQTWGTGETHSLAPATRPVGRLSGSCWTREPWWTLLQLQQRCVPHALARARRIKFDRRAPIVGLRATREGRAWLFGESDARRRTRHPYAPTWSTDSWRRDAAPLAHATTRKMAAAPRGGGQEVAAVAVAVVVAVARSHGRGGPPHLREEHATLQEHVAELRGADRAAARAVDVGERRVQPLHLSLIHI